MHIPDFYMEIVNRFMDEDSSLIDAILEKSSVKRDLALALSIEKGPFLEVFPKRKIVQVTPENFAEQFANLQSFTRL